MCSFTPFFTQCSHSAGSRFSDSIQTVFAERMFIIVPSSLTEDWSVTTRNKISAHWEITEILISAVLALITNTNPQTLNQCQVQCECCDVSLSLPVLVCPLCAAVLLCVCGACPLSRSPWGRGTDVDQVLLDQYSSHVFYNLYFCHRNC